MGDTEVMQALLRCAISGHPSTNWSHVEKSASGALCNLARRGDEYSVRCLLDYIGSCYSSDKETARGGLCDTLCATGLPLQTLSRIALPDDRRATDILER